MDAVTRRVLSIFLLSRLIFLSFAFLASYLIPLQEGYLGRMEFPNEPYLVWIWANFDGRHFLNIVENGYRNFNFAFFPLYPILIKFLDEHLLFNSPYGGILISLVSFFLATIVIYKIIRLDYGEKVARLSIILVSFFPLSFFYQAVYSDALFLLCSTTSFYFARRGNWLLAGLFGGLTTLTRLAGLALLPALFIEWCIQNQEILKSWKYSFTIFWRKCFSALCLIMLGFLSYLVYLQINYGNFLLFQESMLAWRQHEFTFPPQVIFRYLKIFLLVDKGLIVYWVALVEFISMITYFVLTYYVAKKVRLSYAVLMLFIFLLPTFTGTFAGMPRYILHTFPAFVGLAILLNKYQKLKLAVIIVFLVLGFIFTGLFTRGYFIA